MRGYGVLQLGDVGDEHAIYFPSTILECNRTLDMHYLLEHSGEQGIPEFHLSFSRFHQPIRVSAPFCFIKKLMLSKSGWVDDTDGDGKRVQ